MPEARSPETCPAPAGAWVPRVDPARCEGKAACIAVCPVGVFALGRIEPAVRAALPPLARLRSRLHGGRLALTPNADACRACGACVAACPESAIRLERTPRAA